MDKVLRLTIDKDMHNLPVEDLCSLLSLLVKAIHASDPKTSSEFNLRYSLVELTEGSTVVSCVANNAYVGEHQVSKFTRQMADPEKRRTVRAFSSLQKRCNELDVTLAVYSGKTKKPYLKLVPEPPQEKVKVNGITTIYGTLEAIGGYKTVSAKIKQFGLEGLTTAYISREQAKEMAKFLYKEVWLEGEAIWDVETLDITRFSATSFGLYAPKPMSETLEKLAQLTGPGMWHDTNQSIEDFLVDLRRGGNDEL